MNSIRENIVKGLIIIFFLTIVVISYLRFIENENYKNKGKELIEKIEEYKQKHGKLPENLSDLGVIEAMGEGPYYEKIDSINYIVYFNIGFDNRKVYYSYLKKWVDEP